MRVKDCKSELDIIQAIEGDTLEVETMGDFKKVFAVVYSLKNSQGFYSRLYRDMKEAMDSGEVEAMLPFSM